MVGRTPLARVIVLGGPSGSGKTRLAERLSLPVVPLDEFYKDDVDPTMPRIGGHLDWESPQSWKLDDALDALRSLCYVGTAQIPTYSYTLNRATGTQTVSLLSSSPPTEQSRPPRRSAPKARPALPLEPGSAPGSPEVLADAPAVRFVVTEGIFASEVLAPLRADGLLADAIVIRNPPLTTFRRRLRRDLGDHRKPVRDILRIGAQKVRAEAAILQDLESAGCVPMSSRDAETRLRSLIAN